MSAAIRDHDGIMADLGTSYLGLPLTSPIVASAGPVTAEAGNFSRLAHAGVGAIVLPSLFEEEIEENPREIDGYLRLIEAARRETDVAVIASLNGARIGGWIRTALLLQDAGANAVELNLYTVAADPTMPGAMLEGEQLALVELLSDELSIPVATKISPYYSSVSAFIRSLESAGSDGVVLFNRFYQPDLDLETMDLSMRLALSSPEEVRLPLRWIAVMRSHLAISIAASTGIHHGQDAAKVILAGADVAMVTSALIRNGPEHVATMNAQLREWMDEHGHESIPEMRGLASMAQADDPEAFERANYLRNLASHTTGFRRSRAHH